MLTCIACSKQLADSGEETARGTPSTKEAGKSLTAQIKDIALKFSGAYRQCKPSTSSSNYHKSQRHYSDFDSNSEGNSYLRAGSSSSTPAWDFNNLNRDFSVLGSDMRHKGPMTGDHGGEESKYNSTRSCNVVLVDEDESKEWMAQVEPGVHITFISLPHGGNDLKRIRFSREMFNKWQAQRWWGENYDRIMELYNVQKFNRQALPTPPRSEDEKDSYMGSARESPITPSVHKERLARNSHKPISTSNAPSKGCVPLLESSEAIPHPNNHVNIGSSYTGNGNCGKGETSSVDASRTTTSSREEASVSLSNASDAETEWVEQDEPGVYITIRALLDGTRELRRVRFSRERFGEAHAKLWWEENRERIQAQYL